MEFMGSVKLCDNISHWVQPPDTENRMSSGPVEVTGVMPVSRADHHLNLMALLLPDGVLSRS